MTPSRHLPQPVWLAIWLLAFGGGAAAYRLAAPGHTAETGQATETAASARQVSPERRPELDQKAGTGLSPREISELERQVKESFDTRLDEPAKTEAMRAAVRLLAADPAAINRIYALSGGTAPGRLGDIFSRIYADCPSLLWPVLQRAGFATEKINLSLYQITEAAAYDVTGALGTVLLKPDCLGNRFEDTVMKTAAESYLSAERLVQEAAAGRSLTDEQRESIAEVLQQNGSPLPDWARETKSFKQRQEYLRLMDDTRAWAESGFAGTPPEQGSLWIGQAVQRGLTLTPEQEEASFAPGREGIRDSLFYAHCMTGEAERGVKMADRAVQDGRPIPDEIVVSMMNVLYAHSPADPADSMTLLGYIQNPSLRAERTDSYLTRWAKDDPQAALDYLPAVTDEALREKMKATAESALTVPSEP